MKLKELKNKFFFNNIAVAIISITTTNIRFTNQYKNGEKLPYNNIKENLEAIISYFYHLTGFQRLKLSVLHERKKNAVTNKESGQ